MKKEYRKGGVGAMMDEYERAAETLKSTGAPPLAARSRAKSRGGIR